MQRASMWLNLYGRQGVQCKLKKGLKCIFCVFSLFLELKTESLKFSRKNIENWGSWKSQFFLSRPFWFFFQKKGFASFQWKSVIIYRIARMGQNFDDYPNFQSQTTPATCLKIYNTVLLIHFFFLMYRNPSLWLFKDQP